MWKPVITAPKDILRISEKIEEIAALLSLVDRKQTDFSLLNGTIGTAIFLAYYGRYRKSEFHLELAGELITNTIDNLNDAGTLSLTYANGVSGVFWGIQHLIHEGFIEADANELFTDVDELIYKEMISQIKAENFDYLHGGLGMMLYLLKRYQPKDIGKLNDALQALTDKALFGEEKKTAKWVSTVIIENTSCEVYNLSLSHGITSIINIVARYLSEAKDTANYTQHKLLLNAAINYLKEQQNPPESTFLFPNYIFSKTNQKAPSGRIAWCYGDLGMSIALWKAGDFMKDESLKQYSLYILEHFHKQNAYKLTGVRDGALCHGTVGIAHIYHRLYNYTHIEEFKAMAAKYYADTLDFASHLDGQAGYKATNGSNGFKDSMGLLEGVSGIGLSLISAISRNEPKWDECLLLS